MLRSCHPYWLALLPVDARNCETLHRSMLNHIITVSRERYTLSSSLCFSFFLSFFLFLYTAQFSNPTHCNRDIHFLPLLGFLLSFFLSFFLYTIQLVTEIYTFFLSGFPFSLNAGCILSVPISLRLQFEVIEQEYLFLYFLSGVAWDESDKFHHYQMSLIFPFINYQRLDFRSCSFKVKTATDSQVNF
ncbi:unnamed protein product [Acanthosepion pharaonis]|uniref:Uncharacterized protein n=1 Tax=Acanthosepion pharaonis TaxID=158019 RepID=A0A812ANQ8_ACAPH|nr:unnamed protein product [Sepia pharaonis]